MELFVDIFLPSLKPNQILSQNLKKKKKTKIRERKTMQLGEIAPQILKKLPSQNLGYVHLTRPNMHGRKPLF